MDNLIQKVSSRYLKTKEIPSFLRKILYDPNTPLNVKLHSSSHFWSQQDHEPKIGLKLTRLLSEFGISSTNEEFFQLFIIPWIDQIVFPEITPLFSKTASKLGCGNVHKGFLNIRGKRDGTDPFYLSGFEHLSQRWSLPPDDVVELLAITIDRKKNLSLSMKTSSGLLLSLGKTNIFSLSKDPVKLLTSIETESFHLIQRLDKHLEAFFFTSF